MKFSLSSEIISAIPELPSENVDIFTFFQIQNALDLSSNSQDILTAVLSSLRQKKGVLILDHTIAENEKFDFNRGVRVYEGRGFYYLAPHSSSLLRTQIHQEIHTFQDVKRILILSKLLKSLVS